MAAPHLWPVAHARGDASGWLRLQSGGLWIAAFRCGLSSRNLGRLVAVDRRRRSRECCLRCPQCHRPGRHPPADGLQLPGPHGAAGARHRRRHPDEPPGRCGPDPGPRADRGPDVRLRGIDRAQDRHHGDCRALRSAQPPARPPLHRRHAAAGPDGRRWHSRSGRVPGRAAGVRGQLDHLPSRHPDLPAGLGSHGGLRHPPVQPGGIRPPRQRPGRLASHPLGRTVSGPGPQPADYRRRDLAPESGGLE